MSETNKNGNGDYDFYLRIVLPETQPLLTMAEEKQLARSIELGDETARDKLITRNLGLVFSKARVYSKYGSSFEDLFGAGVIGLINAVSKFDPHKFKNRFSTYAVECIKDEINEELLKGQIHIPLYLSSFFRLWNTFKKEYQIRTGESVNNSVLLHIIGMPEEHLEKLAHTLDNASNTDKTVSFDIKIKNHKDGLNDDASYVTIFQDKSAPLESIVAKNEEQQQLANSIQQLMPYLKPQVKRAVALFNNSAYSGEKDIIASIGRELRVTRERARQYIYWEFIPYFRLERFHKLWEQQFWEQQEQQKNNALNKSRSSIAALINEEYTQRIIMGAFHAIIGEVRAYDETVAREIIESTKTRIIKATHYKKSSQPKFWETIKGVYGIENTPRMVMAEAIQQSGLQPQEFILKELAILKRTAKKMNIAICAIRNHTMTREHTFEDRSARTPGNIQELLKTARTYLTAYKKKHEYYVYSRYSKTKNREYIVASR